MIILKVGDYTLTQLMALRKALHSANCAVDCPKGSICPTCDLRKVCRDLGSTLLVLDHKIGDVET